MEPSDTDDVVSALQSVMHALEENQARTEIALERAAEDLHRWRAGSSYTEIIESSKHPVLVQLLTTDILELQSVGHELRSVLARVLRQEGASTQRIAQLFGVSRQRIMVLLKTGRTQLNGGNDPAIPGGDQSTGAEAGQPPRETFDSYSRARGGGRS